MDISALKQIVLETKKIPTRDESTLLLLPAAQQAVFDKICADCAVLKTLLGDDLTDDTKATLVVELVRFLLLKALVEDVDASDLSPSPIVDRAWHVLMQKPVLYSSVCDRLLSATVTAPRLLDHNPAGKDCARQKERYQMTLRGYRAVFGAPSKKFWPVDGMSSSSGTGGASVLGKRPASFLASVAASDASQIVFEHENDSVILIFRFPGGEILAVKMKRSTKLSNIFGAIERDMENAWKPKSVCETFPGVRFIYQDGYLARDKTPAMNKMENGDEVFVFYGQQAC